MKELFKRFDLQLFAEDPAPDATPPEQNPDEEGAPGGPERKYSDEDVDRIISQKFAEWEKKQQKRTFQVKKCVCLPREWLITAYRTPTKGSALF